MMVPVVRDLAANPIPKVPVAVICQVLGFSKQAFHKWRAQPGRGHARPRARRAPLVRPAVGITRPVRPVADDLASKPCSRPPGLAPYADEAGELPSDRETLCRWMSQC